MKTYKEILNEIVDFGGPIPHYPSIPRKPRYPYPIHDGPHCPHPNCPHEREHDWIRPRRPPKFPHPREWLVDPERPRLEKHLKESSHHDEIVKDLIGGSIDDGITGHGFRKALKAGYSKDKIIDILKQGWGDGEERFRRGGTAHEVYDRLDMTSRPIKYKHPITGRVSQYTKSRLNIGIRKFPLNPEDHLPDHLLQTEKEWKEKHDRLYSRYK